MSEKEEYSTTPEHFAIFQEECRRWIREFGLVGWEIFFEHEEDDKNRAFCRFNVPGRVAILSLSTKWNFEPTEYNVRRCAFHEVCELLLAPLKATAETRIIGPDEVEEQVHVVIRTLENAFWDKIDALPPSNP